jgi:hypothetical protein
LGDKNNRCPLASPASTVWIVLVFSAPSHVVVEPFSKAESHLPLTSHRSSSLPFNPKFLSNSFVYTIYARNLKYPIKGTLSFKSRQQQYSWGHCESSMLREDIWGQGGHDTASLWLFPGIIPQ